MLTKLGHVGEAIKTLTTALRTAPHERTVRVTLAQAYIANGQFEQALQELQAAPLKFGFEVSDHLLGNKGIAKMLPHLHSYCHWLKTLFFFETMRTKSVLCLSRRLWQ